MKPLKCGSCGSPSLVMLCLECERTVTAGANPFNGWASFGTYAFIKRLDDPNTASDWSESAWTTWSRHNLNVRHVVKASKAAREELAGLIRDDMANERPLDGIAADVFDFEVARMDFDALADALLAMYVPEYRAKTPHARIDE